MITKQKQKQKQKGLSLPEVLVLIFILVVLVALLYPAVQVVRNAAKRAQEEMLNNAYKAVEIKVDISPNHRFLIIHPGFVNETIIHHPDCPCLQNRFNLQLETEERNTSNISNMSKAPFLQLVK